MSGTGPGGNLARLKSMTQRPAARGKRPEECALWTLVPGPCLVSCASFSIKQHASTARRANQPFPATRVPQAERSASYVARCQGCGTAWAGRLFASPSRVANDSLFVGRVLTRVGHVFASSDRKSVV